MGTAAGRQLPLPHGVGAVVVVPHPCAAVAFANVPRRMPCVGCSLTSRIGLRGGSLQILSIASTGEGGWEGMRGVGKYIFWASDEQG